MATELSSVHLYTSATQGGQDGTQVTETAGGSPTIAVAALRGIYSDKVAIGIRVSNGDCYIVWLTPVGDNADKIQFSTDGGATWGSKIGWLIVSHVNIIFHIRTFIAQTEDYGPDNFTQIQMEYWAPV